MNNYRRYQTLPARPVKKTTRPATKLTAKLKKAALASLCLLLVSSVFSAGLSVRLNQHAAAETAWRQQQKEIFAQKLKEIMAVNGQIQLSVSAASLGTGPLQTFGDARPQDAASTAKVLTAIYYLKLVESGQEKFEQYLGGTTAKRQLQLMVQQSDDTAWQLFNQKLGHQSLERYAHSLGLSSYQVDNNCLSSADLTRLLKALADGQLLSFADSRLLLSYMQHTNYEDFITPAVPAGYQIYHKVGIDDDQINDAAIIQAPDGQAFVLTIMTNGHGLYQWPQRARLIQQIAQTAITAYLQ